MRDTIINTESRERVLQAAEHLFAQRGYSSVTLRDIAAEVGIRHTSLYHHVPGGKEELFVEVTARNLARHRQGLTEAIEQAGPDLRAQLQAVAGWLLSQPPMDLVRMVHSDLEAINPAHAERLTTAAYDAMLSPIEQALEQAQRAGTIRHHNLGLIAGGLLGMLEALHAVPKIALEQSLQSMADELIDMVLNGLRPR